MYRESYDSEGYCFLNLGPAFAYLTKILGDNMEILKNIGLIILTVVCIILLIKYIFDAPPGERKWWRWPWRL